MDNNNNNSNNNRGYRPGQRNNQRSNYQEQSEFYEKVVQVNRVSKKGKGGDKRSLSVIVVVGDKKGKVGVGLGKATDAQSAVRKASSYAKRHMYLIHLKDGRTITHDIYVKLGAAKVLLKPAPEGTGVIAGGAVRVVAEAAGIRDIVSKTLGTKNQASNVYATIEALRKLKAGPVKVEKVKPEEKKEEEKAEKVAVVSTVVSTKKAAVKKETK